MKAAQPGDKGDIAACRRVLTFNNLRNVVTIDLHFITLLIFVADKAGIVIYGGLTVGQNHATLFGCHDVIAAATENASPTAEINTAHFFIVITPIIAAPRTSILIA